MVDFKKLRAAKNQPVILDPIEIFRRLPKPLGINDLYTSQAQVLQAWHGRRNDCDLVIKLHTGGGKTLVGLLIAQSILNETHEPVIYLSPTRQLVQQILTKASEYNIPAVDYKTYEQGGGSFPEEFLAGKSVLICTYHALFNGRSRFGVHGRGRVTSVGGIILDDAHVAFSTVRDSFTLRIVRDKTPGDYEYLANLFRNSFRELGKVGTFDDIIRRSENTVLEVPYWDWKAKSELVLKYLQEMASSDWFQWSFLRDAFDYCHCLISPDAFTLTPIFPLVDLIPTFAECRRRIFMSATIGDDSAIVRTFNTNFESIANPISSRSLAGVSERMILIPELMSLPVEKTLRALPSLVKWSVEKLKAGTVILVPSDAAATQWQDVATFADSTEKVAASVKELQEGKRLGPFVFANRYDGIDLPGQACRLLIVDGLPHGTGEYERYHAIIFSGGVAFNSALAQRIEQGMGRGARGAGDYCLVVIIGKSLVAWISSPANTKFLTRSTRAQLEMGMKISKQIASGKDLMTTIGNCLQRDKDWTEYHAETLAELVEPDQIDVAELTQASVERNAFRLLRDGNFEKAVGKLEKYIQETDNLDEKSRGWLLQLAARIAYYWGRKDIAQRLQQSAYASNHSLLRPQVLSPYRPLNKPGKQAEAIVTRILKFNPRKGYIADFEDKVVSHLVPEASAYQFEQALEDLGSTLGFVTERPDKTSGKGPDVLWLLNDNRGLVIEAKSRKNKDNPLKKEEHGQLLNAGEWFKEKYPNYPYTCVSVHPNVKATRSIVTNESRALTFDKLYDLVANTHELLDVLCESIASYDDLVVLCEKLLADSTINPLSLTKQYLQPFESTEE